MLAHFYTGQFGLNHTIESWGTDQMFAFVVLTMCHTMGRGLIAAVTLHPMLNLDAPPTMFAASNPAMEEDDSGWSTSISDGS